MSEDDDDLKTEDEDTGEYISCTNCGEIVNPDEDDVFEASGLSFCNETCHQQYLDT